jgi:hypothetical protein
LGSSDGTCTSADFSLASLRQDPEYLIKLFEAYFDGFGKLDRQLQVD